MKTKTIILFLFCLNYSSSQWIKSLDTKAGISDILVHNNTIYAGTYGSGLYLSKDEGISWKQISSGLTPFRGVHIRCLAIKDSYLFAGVDGDGVFRLSLNDTLWEKANDGFPISDTIGVRVFSLVAKDTNLFAGTFDFLGMYISKNNGVSWSKSGLTDTCIDALEVNKDTILAGAAASGGVYLSTDDGITWKETLNDVVYRFARTDKYLFACSIRNIFVSNNFGASWSETNFSFPNVITTTVFAIQELLFVGTYSNGIFLSTDVGKSWDSVNSNFPENATISSFGTKGDYLFVGTSKNGVWRRRLLDFKK